MADNISLVHNDVRLDCISFLNLDDLAEEESLYLLNVIGRYGSDKGAAMASASIETPFPWKLPFIEPSLPTSVSTVPKVLISSPSTPFGSNYNALSGNDTQDFFNQYTLPYHNVYINNVTANVNVHSAPTAPMLLAGEERKSRVSINSFQRQHAPSSQSHVPMNPTALPFVSSSSVMSTNCNSPFPISSVSNVPTPLPPLSNGGGAVFGNNSYMRPTGPLQIFHNHSMQMYPPYLALSMPPNPYQHLPPPSTHHVPVSPIVRNPISVMTMPPGLKPIQPYQMSTFVHGMPSGTLHHPPSGSIIDPNGYITGSPASHPFPSLHVPFQPDTPQQMLATQPQSPQLYQVTHSNNGSSHPITNQPLIIPPTVEDTYEPISGMETEDAKEQSCNNTPVDDIPVVIETPFVNLKEEKEGSFVVDEKEIHRLGAFNDVSVLSTAVDDVKTESDYDDATCVESDKSPLTVNMAEKMSSNLFEETKEEEESANILSSSLDNKDEQTSRSWASLFHKNEELVDVVPPVPIATVKPTARIQPYLTSVSSQSQCNGVNNYVDFDRELQLAHLLQEYGLNHYSVVFHPRGLSNRSNWCFVNAILQALVACPPFFNLIKALPPLPAPGDVDAFETNICMMKSLQDFIAEFPITNNVSKFRREKSSVKKSLDLPLGITFEASSIFKMLLNLSPSDTFRVVEGDQEDAEEFLTFLLNRINDEMVALKKLLENSSDQEEEEEAATQSGEVSNSDDNEWLEVGPKRRACITRRHSSAVNGVSPISDMIQGQIRSCVQHASGEPTATLQPFFTLQLDITSENVVNVNDALISNFGVEVLDGYICSRTKREVEASRCLSLEHLPPILILHLKRFIYDEKSLCCQKLLKNIDFPITLDITRDILSAASRGRFIGKQRQYKLFAVVYHNGVQAIKGHYVTDVFNSGMASWFRCDDGHVKAISEATVLSHTVNSVPYILFYRRCDTVIGTAGGGNSNSEKNRGKSHRGKSSLS